MARLCGTKLSKDSRKLQEKACHFGFTFSGPKKYTRLSPIFVARAPQDGVQEQTKSVLFEEKTLARDSGKGPGIAGTPDKDHDPGNRRMAANARYGFACHKYDASDAKFTKPYKWQHCVNMHVGE